MENEKIKEGEYSYEKVKAIVKEVEGDELREKFKKVIGKTNENRRIAYAADWLSLALNLGERQLAERFLDAFFDDFEKFDPWLITNPVMRLEGIEDIGHMDAWGPSQGTPQGGPFGFSRLKLSSDIYSRSKYDTPLLIIGETGTSKEFLAKAIRKMSNRRKEPFVDINCAGIHESILESELFGVVANYPGFHNLQALIGKFQLADKGILFLDEIGRMPEQLQVKILKVMDEKSFYPLGSSEMLKVDVRFIAATQPKYVMEKKIIPDLFWRLGGPDYIQMPTLRERLTHDPLAYVGIIQNSKDCALAKMPLKRNITISESAYDKLRVHEYRGNYRELESILTAAIRKAQLQKRDEILPEDLEETMSKSKKYSEEEIPSKSEGENDLRDIKLKDIIDYAEKKKASIIETKIHEILSSGKNVKSVLRGEGLSEKDYQNFRKKIVTAIGKNLKELGL